MQTKDKCTSPVSANLNQTLVLTDKATPKHTNGCAPLAGVATEQLANMKAWLTSAAGITVLGLYVIDREAGNKYRPFRHTITTIKYLDRQGEQVEWSLSTFGLGADVSGVRLEWWAYLSLTASLIETMTPCQRCQGQATNTGGTRSLDLRHASCKRCWGRRADPAVTDFIRTGGDPTKVQIIAD